MGPEGQDGTGLSWSTLQRECSRGMCEGRRGGGGGGGELSRMGVLPLSQHNAMGASLSLWMSIYKIRMCVKGWNVLSLNKLWILKRVELRNRRECQSWYTGTQLKVSAACREVSSHHARGALWLLDTPSTIKSCPGGALEKPLKAAVTPRRTPQVVFDGLSGPGPASFWSVNSSTN